MMSDPCALPLTWPTSVRSSSWLAKSSRSTSTLSQAIISPLSSIISMYESYYPYQNHSVSLCLLWLPSLRRFTCDGCPIYIATLAITVSFRRFKYGLVLPISFNRSLVDYINGVEQSTLLSHEGGVERRYTPGTKTYNNSTDKIDDR